MIGIGGLVREPLDLEEGSDGYGCENEERHEGHERSILHSGVHPDKQNEDDGRKSKRNGRKDVNWISALMRDVSALLLMRRTCLGPDFHPARRLCVLFRSGLDTRGSQTGRLSCHFFTIGMECAAVICTASRPEFVSHGRMPGLNRFLLDPVLSAEGRLMQVAILHAKGLLPGDRLRRRNNLFFSYGFISKCGT